MNQLQVNEPAAGVAPPPSILDDQIDLTDSHGGDKQSDALLDPSEALSEVNPLHAAGGEDDGDAHHVVSVTAGVEQADPPDGVGDEPAATPIDGSDAQMAVAVADDSDHHELLHAAGDEQEAVAEEGGADEQTDEEGADPKPEMVGGIHVHPLCAMFPEMGDKEMKELTDDIRTNGLLHPIVKYKRQIVDGRHRAKACRAAFVQPKFVNWLDIYKGPMSLSQWIWSVNAQRRHMTDEQIGAARFELIKYEKTEAARQRQIAAGSAQGGHGAKGGRGNKKPLAANSPQGVLQPTIKPVRDHSRDSRAEIAKELNWSEHKTQDLINIDKKKPGAVKAIIKGTTTVKQEKKALKESAPKRAHTRVKTKSPTGNPEPKATTARSPFDMEPALLTAMAAVDAAFELVPADWRDDFKQELIENIQRLP
jgi:hypothetical protein